MSGCAENFGRAGDEGGFEILETRLHSSIMLSERLAVAEFGLWFSRLISRTLLDAAIQPFVSQSIVVPDERDERQRYRPGGFRSCAVY